MGQYKNQENKKTTQREWFYFFKTARISPTITAICPIQKRNIHLITWTFTSDSFVLSLVRSSFVARCSIFLSTISLIALSLADSALAITFEIPAR